MTVFWLGVTGMAAMAVHLLAARCASWALVPASALVRARWWHRSAPAILAISAVVVLLSRTGLLA